MALTTTVTQVTFYTPEIVLYKVDVAFDSSYPTGGETLDMTGYVSKIEAAWIGSQSMAVSSKFIKIDYTNVATGTIALEVHDTTDEEANASDQSAVNDIVVYIIGKALG